MNGYFVNSRMTFVINVNTPLYPILHILIRIITIIVKMTFFGIYSAFYFIKFNYELVNNYTPLYYDQCQLRCVISTPLYNDQCQLRCVISKLIILGIIKIFTSIEII